jgi:site-specific recombinase XerD
MAKFVWKQRLHSLNTPDGPLIDQLSKFQRLLAEQGYPRESIRRYLLLVADFSVWLKAQGVSLKQVAHEHGERYLRCRSRYRRRTKGNVHALQRFMELLQHDGLVRKDTPAARTALERLVDDYSTYLHQERGLADTTVKKYVRAAHLFLIQQRVTKVRDLSSLSAQRVIRFFQSERAGKCSATRAQHLAIGLRSFLRYARYRGHFRPDLAAAIPRVAGWSMTSIPKAISPKDAQRVLASCDRRSAVGRRDYAMLLLLAQLGLRAGEVASLTLDDIDWHAGTLTVHGKGSQEAPLPLLEPIGKAIAAYLKRGRPHCESRRVFLRMHAPIRGFKTEKPVSTAVGRAIQRARIDSPHRGAHQFRHALATHMLSRRSSLAEISEILRHKDPDTTRIYAKVDLTSLRVLAAPWPRT